MSAKECGHDGDKQRKFFRRVFAGISIFIIIILATVLIVWAILQPSKPTFFLQDATVYSFNISSPYLLTSYIQITVSSRNPNDKIGVYYDKLDVYAVYRNQQITLRTSIQPTYQSHKETDVWSPYLYGPLVPIAPYNAAALDQDRAFGKIRLHIKVDARVRWKVGTFVSGKYHLYATCPADIVFGNPQAGIVMGNDPVKYQVVQQCSVSV